VAVKRSGLVEIGRNAAAMPHAVKQQRVQCRALHIKQRDELANRIVIRMNVQNPMEDYVLRAFNVYQLLVGIPVLSR